MSTPSDKPETPAAAEAAQQEQAAGQEQATGAKNDAPQKAVTSGLPSYMLAPGEDNAKADAHAPEADASAEAGIPADAPGSGPELNTDPAATPAEAGEWEQEEPLPGAAAFGLGAAVGAAEAEASRTIAVEPDGTAHAPVPDAGPDAGPNDSFAAERDSASGPAAAKASAADAAPSWDYTARQADAPQPPAGGKAPQTPPKAAAPGAKAPPKGKAPSTPRLSFGAAHPVLGVEQSMPHSVSSRLFNALALLPILPLTLILLLQTLFSLDARDLWFADEVQSADAFRNLLEHGKGLMLQVNGLPWPDKPPLYFWFLRGLYALLPSQGPLLHLAAAAVAGLLYLWAALGLGRMAGRVDGRGNLAAGILLLGGFYIMGMLHYNGMAMLFAALIVCSHIFLYRALVSPKGSVFCMVLAFVLAGLAALVNGPLAVALPIWTALLFVLWRGSADQIRCVLVFVAALFCGLLPIVAGPELALRLGLLPEASPLPLEWALGFLAPPALLLIVLALAMPRLRLCALLSILLMAGAFILCSPVTEPSWPVQTALPLLAGVLLLLWQITPQRPFRLDFFIGLAAGFVTAGLWFIIIYIETGNSNFILNAMLAQQPHPDQTLDFLKQLQQGPALDMLLKQLPVALAPAAAAESVWHFLLLRLPLLSLPWIVLLICLPWQRFMGKGMREGLGASRRPEKEGLGFLWCMAIACLGLLLSSADKELAYALPALPPLALLAARAVLGLGGRQAGLFRLTMALLMLVSGILTVIGGLMLFDVLPMPSVACLPQWKLATNGGFFIAAGILLVAGALLWFGLSSSRPEGVLLLTALTATALGYPLGGLIMPSFDEVMSPRKQALLMRAYMDKGYEAAAFGTRGALSFYAGRSMKELKELNEAGALAEKGNLVLSLKLSDWESWENKPQGLTEVQRQWMGRDRYLLLAKPPLENLTPAPLPYTPTPDMLHQAIKGLGLDLPFLKGASPVAPPAKPPVEKPQDSAPVATPESAPASPAPAPQEPDAADAAAQKEAAPTAEPETPTEPEAPAEQEVPAAEAASTAEPETPTEQEAPVKPEAPVEPEEPAAEAAAAPPEQNPDKAPDADAAPASPERPEQEAAPAPQETPAPQEAPAQENAAPGDEGNGEPAQPAPEQAPPAPAETTPEATSGTGDTGDTGEQKTEAVPDTPAS